MAICDIASFHPPHPLPPLEASRILGSILVLAYDLVVVALSIVRRSELPIHEVLEFSFCPVSKNEWNTLLINATFGPPEQLRPDDYLVGEVGLSPDPLLEFPGNVWDDELDRHH